MGKSKVALFCLIFIVFSFLETYAQEDDVSTTYNNHISTNLFLPLFESFDLSYERTIANTWAVGLAGAIYGDRISELSTGSSGDIDRFDTNYEIMPFGRLYFQGAQNKSHFIELFGSLSQVTESRRFVRNTNVEGFGVYERGIEEYTVGGLGFGYGYRFLLLEKKLVLEGEFGIRTNFNTDFFFLNATLVRTGIKVGYRF
ncbi:hypothetical protein [Maribacter sp. 2210JD10-5]|uniref:hypothetical protein n=1 Tax=Maribacter sp. 2210JD10-5 TaxID=3386272 RepID=UPI0039BD8640